MSTSMHGVICVGVLRSLGSFARFEDDYRAMVFENGQHCWSGPNRSIRVRQFRLLCPGCMLLDF